ncbi:hypothetical protein ckrop_2074 [Corynebacterium kroppenstedtii DSM 44385]|uniref:Uncharacterized protein n=1 Tax=Corynebacterium kroppenstedtii (strain DSM 44385 / JCM 11950 / CIP 105744 / CCUG 35717) TaxID=645127 RepID=C4LGF4_CORK4|nr:hypothetical protein ckrop_2074 [Corynebacterium kroppenstedtii DSM 44385]
MPGPLYDPFAIGGVAPKCRGLLGFERVSSFRDGIVDVGIAEVFTFDGHVSVVENSDVLYSACLRYRVFDGGGSFVGAHAGDGVILHHGGISLWGTVVSMATMVGRC